MREENKSADVKLDINQIIAWLDDDGMLSLPIWKNAGNTPRAGVNRQKHPLKVLADCELGDQTQPRQTVDAGRLDAMAGQKTWASAITISIRLKIDVANVTNLFSKAYTSNYNILPIAINDDEVVIATAEPYVRAWQTDLAKMHKGKIRLRVFQSR